MSTELLQGRTASAITTNYHHNKSAYLVQVLVLPNAVKVSGKVAKLLEHPDTVINLADSCASLEKAAADTAAKASSNDVELASGLGGLHFSGAEYGRKMAEAMEEEYESQVANVEYHLCRLGPLSTAFHPKLAISATAREALLRVSLTAEELYAKQRSLLAAQHPASTPPNKLVPAKATNPGIATDGKHTDLPLQLPLPRYRELHFELNPLLSDYAADFANSLRFMSSYFTLCLYVNEQPKEALVITVGVR
jgi:hypothetical protein